MWAARVQVEGLETRLDRIRRPIVFIHGTSDRGAPIESIEYAVERFRGHPDAHVVVLIGGRHSGASGPARRTTQRPRAPA
jgi:pimeloyl-ACP methyl ester carboxylesterase